jgi:MerR family redox-sensitive transcriptional activator SoxR
MARAHKLSTSSVYSCRTVAVAILLTIGEVPRRSGVAASALRFYEERGLISSERAKLPPDHVPTRRDWSRLSRKWTSRIDERIAEFERLKLGLTECIGCGCLSLDRCELANRDDRAAGLGSGPRYWIGDRPLGG